MTIDDVQNVVAQPFRLCGSRTVVDGELNNGVNHKASRPCVICQGPSYCCLLHRHISDRSALCLDHLLEVTAIDPAQSTRIQLMFLGRLVEAQS